MKKKSIKRVPISKKLRFEVFKRDSFTCQYCGNESPDVLLEIDHIDPVSKGGKNNILNLITACKDCNRGKTNIKLNDNSLLKKQKKQLDDFQERKNQINLMFKWKKELLNIEELELQKLNKYWGDLLNKYSFTESGIKAMKLLLKKNTIKDIIDAMDIAVCKYVVVDDNGKHTHESVNIALKKIGGILTIEKSSKDDPYIKNIYYIRGILKNRLDYIDNIYCIPLIRRAIAVGCDVQELMELAKQSTSWSWWESDIEALIDKVEKNG